MQCNNIVFFNLPTLDSREEIDENRKSLVRKYEARGVACHQVDLPSGAVPDLSGKGTVGVYVLSHTKDVVPSALAKQLFDGLFVKGADVKKISIACCRAASGDGPMNAFCLALAGLSNDTVTLPDGLLVSGFTVNVTTFDAGSRFFEEEGKKFANFAAIKGQAEVLGAPVRTVQQKWGARGTDEPSFMHFTHEKVRAEDAGRFAREIEALFQESVAEQWKLDRGDFIRNRVNNQLKKNQQIADPGAIDWRTFATDYPTKASNYVQNVFWAKFLDKLRASTPRTAAIWTSLYDYVRMKKVMKYSASRKKFEAAGLTEYCGNEYLKAALSFVVSSDRVKGTTLKFLPEI